MAEIHRIADNNVSVFLRDHRAGECYYARFKIANKKVANGQRYVTESLRTPTLRTALDRARTRYAEISFLERQGRTLKSGTVAQEIELFVSEYELGVKQRLSGYSPNMLRGYRKSVVRYWTDFLGKKRLEDVSLEDMSGYEGWRQAYWTQPKRSTRIHHGNVKQRASKRTIEWEVNAFKQFLRWAHQRGKYSGHALDFRFDPGPRNTRSAFTVAQWNKLTGFMRRKKWQRVGKHENDARLARYRRMLHAYILFMANSGLRVGEARNLRWRDITFIGNGDGGGAQIRVAVASSYSKVMKRREVVGTEGAYRVLKALLVDRKQHGDFADPDDYIWCDSNGRRIKDFREGFNRLIEEAGVKLDADGKKLTCYSLRHTYITSRLRAGVDIYQLATNCGTSVQMIEQYYAHARSVEFALELVKGYRRGSRSAKAGADGKFAPT